MKLYVNYMSFLKNMLMKSRRVQDQKGSFNPKFYSISKRSVYTVRSDGCLIINFGWLNDNENTIKWREKLLEKLKRIEGLATKIPRSAEDKWVSLPIEIWGPRVDEIILLLKKLLEVK